MMSRSMAVDRSVEVRARGGGGCQRNPNHNPQSESFSHRPLLITLPAPFALLRRR
jgi:hypothetical protein